MSVQHQHNNLGTVMSVQQHDSLSIVMSVQHQHNNLGTVMSVQQHDSLSTVMPAQQSQHSNVSTTSA